MNKKILVDMSATLIHHGHIRLLKEASKRGDVIVALTSDEEIRKHKGYEPELQYEHRKEILESIKYVKEVIKSPWHINNEFLKKSGAEYLLHGSDNSNDIDKDKLIIIKRTEGISSSLIRTRVTRTILSKAGLETDLKL
tara:strand:+ start:2250 stop:2666 length:417 start_codon:yes stop_codon:yes gene_type:complete